jgi:LPXTG-motif cell wall-anchored protein
MDNNTLILILAGAVVVIGIGFIVMRRLQGQGDKSQD